MANNPAVHSLNVVLKVKSSQHRPGCSVRESCGGRPQAIDQPVCCEGAHIHRSYQHTWKAMVTIRSRMYRQICKSSRKHLHTREEP